MIRISDLYDIAFTVYFATIMAHCSGSGLDHFLSLASFGAVMLVFLVDVIKHRSMKFDFVNKSMLCFLVIVFCSIMWAVYPEYVFSREYSNILMEGPQMMMISLALAQRIRCKEDVIRYFKIYLIAISYMILIIVVKTPISHYLCGVRIGTVTGLWVNALAKLYCIGLGIIYYLLSEVKKRQRIPLMLMAFILILFTLLTGSKNGILMIIAITFLPFFLHGSYTGKIKIIFLTAILGSSLLYLIFNVPELYNIIGYRMQTFLNIFTSGGGFEADSSTNTRSDLMRFAWKMFLERPILGWGFANVAGYVASQSYFIVTYAHSNYLELLADVGLVGTLVFYAPHISAFQKLFKRVFKKKRKDMLTCTVFTILLVILVTDYASVNITTVYYLAFVQLIYYLARYLEYDSQ